MSKEFDEITFKVLRIIRGTTVDGPGLRTSIYFAGCNHRCAGCHNPQSWDPEAGEEMTLEEIMKVVNEEDFDVTLTGGDPLFYPRKLQVLISYLKKNRRNVWVYTGYTWEQIKKDPGLLSAIKEADVIIDGPYIQELRNIDLPFRGSENQRILFLKDLL